MSEQKRLPEPDGAVLVVEEETAEAALERISAELGPDARIVSAERVRRGGIAGFFAKEVVQLTAERPRRHEAAETLARMSAQAARTARSVASFSETLERAMTTDPAQVEVNTAPVPSVVRAAAGAVGSVSGSPVTALGEVDWSPDSLVRLGLPFALIERVAKLAPRDDLEWIEAIVHWLAPFAGPLPEGPFLLIGPRAGDLAAALGIPHARCPEVPAGSGSVAVSSDPGCPDLGWLAEVQAGRWVHAVVGGACWESVLGLAPKAVSWVGADAVVPAVRACAREGLPFGYGTVGSSVVRARPIEVALAIRSLVGRR